MNRPPQQNAAVLVGFDSSAGARRAVEWAAREAAARASDLFIVQSYEWSVPLIPDVDERMRAYTGGQLEDVAQECRREHPRLRVHTRMPDGPPERTVPEVAIEVAAELLVLGATGLGAIARAVLGSTVAELVHSMTVPIVVVRGERIDPTGPVVVGLDGSDAGDAAAEFALEFAARNRAALHVVHALSTMPVLTPGVPVAATLGSGPVLVEQQHAESAEEIIRMRVARLRERYPRVPVDCVIVPNRPAAALVERANTARLLVVGSHGRGLVERILVGSVSHALLYHATCPVALIRSGGTRVGV